MRKISLKTTLNKKPQLESFIEKKLVLYITIVSQGQANSILKIFEKCGSSAQFVETGEGTASKEIKNILGMESVDKEIIFSFISQDKKDQVREFLDVYFSSRAKNAGISFSIPLASIVGVKAYQFLADTIKEAE